VGALVPLDPDTLRRVRRVVLQNSVQHGGPPRPGPVLARLLATEPDLRHSAAEVETAVKACIGEVASLSPAAVAAALAEAGGPEADRPARVESLTGDLPDLPGAHQGSVVLRMAPFPSGTLHIGNARMIFVNEHYRRKYDGHLLLVFDDTIGSEEKRVDLEVFDLIRKDLEMCRVTPDAIYYKSDRIANFYPWARRVIDAGGAYVCQCPAETLRDNRAHGVECAHRAQTIPETVSGWERMLNGGYGPGEAVLRLRTSLSEPDPAFRDRVLFRISDLEHPRVGRRYRVWPLLEFSWAVDDIELGITHVLRGKDLVMEDRMQQAIWRLLGVTGPSFLHWGLLRVREAKISKSKSYAEVKSGQYDGWADPRTWSIASLDRRGISPEAIRRFTLSFGLSLADIEVPAETLYAENRGLIDATTERRSYVPEPVLLEIQGYPAELTNVELSNHPDHPELGRRTVSAGPRVYLARRDLEARRGMEVRLKDLANIRLPDPLPTDLTGVVPVVFTSRENQRIPRLQWVGAAGAVPVRLLDPEGRWHDGIGEGALAHSAARQVVQLERVGFARLDTGWLPGETPVRLCFGHP
jgi:glutamyl-tRNA synthetase